MALQQREDTDELNPGRNPGDLHAREQFAGSSYAASGASKDESSADDSENTTKNQDDVKSQEESASDNSLNWTGKGKGGENSRSKSTFRAKVKNFTKNKRKMWFFIGGGGLGVTLLTAFMALLPFKLLGFIENITSLAAQVPSYAVEQRAEYIVTRALATRLMMMSDSSFDGKTVFCANGSIACSLWSTYTTNYFEKKMDLNFQKQSNGKILVTVDAEGRSRLGSNARSWVITVHGGRDGLALTTINIDNNPGMKKYIKSRVNSNLMGTNFITRLYARNVLMKAYGVTHWRAFEKTRDKLETKKVNFKTGIFNNTVGKVTPRMGMYMACLSGGATCAEILKQGRTLNTINEGDDDNTRAKKDRNNKTIQSIENSVNGVTLENSKDTVMSKIISKRIITAVGAGAGFVGLADLVFSGVNGVDNGALEEIGQNMMMTAYVGNAFGDGTGVVPNVEMSKDGTNNIDIDVLGYMTEMYNGAEKSPLYAMQNGMGVPTDANSQVTRDCQKVEGEGLEPTKLAPGELLCPENVVVRNYAETLRDNAYWQTLSVISEAWVNSVGGAITFLGSIMETLLSAIPGWDWTMDKFATLVKPGIEWLFGLIVDIPPLGPEATGAQNYDALAGGIAISQNVIMEEGQELGGAGGQLLSDKQVAVITAEQNEKYQDYFDNQSVIARTFDASLRGSFTQRLVATMPTSASGYLSTLANLPRTFMSPNIGAASPAVYANPFNLSLYGYPAGSPELTADPGTYTEDFCVASDKKRNESLKQDPERGVHVYNLTDPCALERVAVGTLLAVEGVADNPYIPNLEEGVETKDANGSDADGFDELEGNDVTLENSGYKTIQTGKWKGWTWPSTAPGSGCGFGCYSGHIGMDIRSAGVGAPFYAMHDGVVTHAGVDPIMNAQLCSTVRAAGVSFKPPQYTIYITHTGEDGERYRVRYTHIKPGTIRVKKGDKVKAGDYIAQTGNSGCTTGPHAHLDVRTKGGSGAYIDPTSIVGTTGKEYLP